MFILHGILWLVYIITVSDSIQTVNVDNIKNNVSANVSLECVSGYFISNGLCESCDHCFNSSCDNETGECLDGCETGWYSAVHTTNCSQQCSDHCIDKECRGDDGFCTKGCINGYYQDCEKVCPTNCFNDTCHRIFGYCTEGCKAGYIGTHCEYPCNNCLNETCHQMQTKCDECKPQWRGDYCQTSCKDCIDGECSPDIGCANGCMPGKYGNYCNFNCSRNCFACEQHLGNCRVCKSNFTGLDCSQDCDHCLNPYENDTIPYEGACLPGSYGLKCDRDCSSSCATREGERKGRCYKFTGLCINGCQVGFYGSDCKSQCGFCNATYGKHFCDSVTGKCPGICLGGYYGDFCTELCSVWCFGENCYQDTGYCSEGCYEHYEGVLCDKKIEPQAHKELSLPAVVGISVAGSVGALFIIGSMIYFIRRRKMDILKNSIAESQENICSIPNEDS